MKLVILIKKLFLVYKKTNIYNPFALGVKFDFETELINLKNFIKMKKYLLQKIEELKYLYPSEKINIICGFIGVELGSNGENLKHPTYIGDAYFMIDNVIYTDYNTKNDKAKKLISFIN